MIELPIVNNKEQQTPAVNRKPPWLKVKLPTGKTIRRCVDWWIVISCTPFVKVEAALTWANAGVQAQQHL